MMECKDRNCLGKYFREIEAIPGVETVQSLTRSLPSLLPALILSVHLNSPIETYCGAYSMSVNFQKYARYVSYLLLTVLI